MRSLITLKALTYAPTGGIVAAPTTSLPEQLGGVRNWDYRYCWLRDATFTLYALLHARLHRARRSAWRDWLLRAVAGDARASCRSCTASAGERRLPELELDWLPGYEGSTPVRIGNAAVDAVPARRLRRGDGRAAPGARTAGSSPTTTPGALQRALLDFLGGALAASPTRASGRCAARAGTSRTPR